LPQLAWPSSNEEYEEIVRSQVLDEPSGEAKLKDLTVDEVQKKAVVSTEHYPKDKDGGAVEFVFTLWMTQDRMKINHVKQFIDTEG